MNMNLCVIVQKITYDYGNRKDYWGNYPQEYTKFRHIIYSFFKVRVDFPLVYS